MAGQLDGIEIYCGKGGFLGIQTHPKDTLVNDVIDGSGAKLAGIEIDDELTHVDAACPSKIRSRPGGPNWASILPEIAL
ncbi:MAG: hypothetical protein R3C56_39105 [Pirellulaceae bacterium]